MTNAEDAKRLRGLAALVRDGIDQGSSAVQRVHMATAARPFAILEAIPAVARPMRVVHVVHDATVGIVYAVIRGVTRAACVVADAAIVATSDDGVPADLGDQAGETCVADVSASKPPVA